MKIEVIREACCVQDDQLGPLILVIDPPDGALIWELAKEIGEANFLQFSGSHNIIDVYCEQKLLFSIPAIGEAGGAVRYEVGREDLASIHLAAQRINCVWPVGL